MLFRIQLQSSVSNCADETSFPLICQCIGPPECECTEWKCEGMAEEDVWSTQHHREIGRLKLAEYEKEKWMKMLDFTAAHCGV